MNPALVFESLHAESTPFKLVFWSAVVATGAAVLQWLFYPSGGQVTIRQVPVLAGSSYATPFGNSTPVLSVPRDNPVVTPVEPAPPRLRARPEISIIEPPPASAPGLRPKSRPELEGIVIAPERGLSPKSRPELGDQP